MPIDSRETWLMVAAFPFIAVSFILTAYLLADVLINRGVAIVLAFAGIVLPNLLGEGFELLLSGALFVITVLGVGAFVPEPWADYRRRLGEALRVAAFGYLALVLALLYGLAIIWTWPYSALVFLLVCIGALWRPILYVLAVPVAFLYWIGRLLVRAFLIVVEGIKRKP